MRTNDGVWLVRDAKTGSDPNNSGSSLMKIARIQELRESKRDPAAMKTVQGTKAAYSRHCRSNHIDCTLALEGVGIPLTESGIPQSDSKVVLFCQSSGSCWVTASWSLCLQAALRLIHTSESTAAESSLPVGGGIS